MKQILQKTQWLIVVFLIPLVFSCNKEESRPTFPLSAEIFHSADGKQVAFSGLTHSAVSWHWDFGDGNTSNEKDPVHIYDQGGYYLVTLTASDASGASVTKDVTLALDLTAYDLLVGDPTKEGYDGKTWKLSATHSPDDILANSDVNLSLFDEDIPSLPAGAFDLFLGLPEAYNDEFTFYQDGKYKHNTADGTSFGGIVYAIVMQQFGQTEITKTGGEDVLGQDAFAITKYEPDDNATFELQENTDYVLPSAFPTGMTPSGIPVVTYEDVTTIDFPGTDEFVGIRDFHQKVIIQNITDDSMRLVMFLTLSPDAIVSQNPLIALATNAVVLTFNVVK
ncbi:PKD domain-containing protein [Membranicola marinus]|uniref:PKD domain-containing protein n=1 Tax=Membranihabitans marinus TaxID=1227546 RepID=A0A953HJ67_9BACT|nr:PKD domain-containing protein [Membranihabitans marinus]MBY5956844.1 PKD domain-containing protein [Membranihabitans marinus]